ncbi:ATP-binding protein [Phytomonospora endophytica]|uniref:Anti-sigma regulatory factor (Ser/Thr protein kinase) n=1 Tax=Phytomonospora endophytica TaxID=714109 RepID=A0A841FF28_9ACTN|nr:ATP-binding protein [Phytomonospora endophytica]MBB6033603.1 anti-sigma regulatory factor (Ser/Thr protein kinase) [Phytomonospora endophytica]GIG64881.1 hypothetical protein Pen01_11760 [Phytomonospora endophytica]
MQTPYAAVAAEHEHPYGVMQMVFAAHPTAVGCSRTFARYAAGRCWGREHLLDDLEVLVSELVTNAVKATAASRAPGLSKVAVRFLLLPSSLVTQVWDPVPAQPVVQPLDPAADGGRGLHIVDALASRWGAFPATGGGKVVWCETPTIHIGPLEAP